MANTKKAVPFIKKRFEYVLEKEGYSKNRFAKKMFPNVVSPIRKLQKYMISQEIAPEILDAIAMTLNVHPGYLRGEYNVTKNELIEQLGDFFPHIYQQNDFDPEGYHFDSYYSYDSDRRQHSIDEEFIAFLNNVSFVVYQNRIVKPEELENKSFEEWREIKHKKFNDDELAEVRFDFHNLDIRAREWLWYDLGDILQKYVAEQTSEAWKQFIEQSLSTESA